MHFNCAEEMLKSNWRNTEEYLIVLKWNYCKYTLNILHLKTDIIQTS